MIADITEQLSVALAVPIGKPNALQPELVNTVISAGTVNIGCTESTTVITAFAVLTLLNGSTTVSVTGFAPRSLQLNVVALNVIVAIEQLSDEPMFTWAGVTVTAPLAFKYALIFCAIAIGAVLSITVTVAVPVLTFPFTSVTVSVTVLAPTFAQVNVDGLTVIVAMPQLSVDPLSI